ncbi:Cobalamin-binding protein [Sulfidibacter corallicola]|uniref:Cobalamin-binding protein n=1 Tax=Sulfidibacter corallicola TaxID=2818388 RepID=A0A8A4TFV3_SULCO|nr:cobalamin-binding protein [Sulfidibacter corallicola]QTD48949.1 cobalamin-binding protein [Sulfidibacter corallicola]
MRKPRIVSLIPSATEIVCALGLHQRLVGRSHECDYPADVATLPICSTPNLNPAKPSREVDLQVRDLVKNALSVYEVDAERLEQLRPTHVVTQDQCAVCAVSVQEVQDALSSICNRDTQVVSVQPRDLQGILDSMHEVGQALEVPFKAEVLVTDLKARINAIYARTHELHDFPKVVCLEWLDPMMGGGHWVPELVRLAGGHDPLGVVGKNAPDLDWARLLEIDPDVLVIFPCGFDLERTRREVATLVDTENWPKLKAVQAGRVYLIDGHTYFNRPGPRIVDSLEILSEILHPGEFSFGHEGTGWSRMAAPVEEAPKSEAPAPEPESGS